MRLVAARYIGVAMQLSALWVVVSSAAQSLLGHLPVEVVHTDAVGEMIAKF
jgi:hypothetical protein